MAHLAVKEGKQEKTSQHGSTPAIKPQTKILLIEDSEDAMLLVRIAMEEHGEGVYQVEWAETLNSGLARLKEGGIDLVLLDLGLPESSGARSYEMVQQSAPEIPILVLTGDTREETEFSVAARGVQDFLIKDEISGSLLLQAIRAALHISKRQDIERARLLHAAKRSNGQHLEENLVHHVPINN